MMIYISCAKTMTARSKKLIPFTTIPEFYNEAAYNIRSLSQFNSADITKMLRVNSKLAAENYFRFQNFFSEDNIGLPAILSSNVFTSMISRKKILSIPRIIC